MKKCKYCKSEIDAKAKVCPHCKKKQGPKIVKWLIIGFIIIGIIGVAISNKEDEKFKKDYKQDETVTYKDVAYSIIKVEKTKGSNQYFQAKDGYEYVKVTIKIENNSNEKISYNSLNFQMVNGDGVEEPSFTITGEEDLQLHSGELDPKGKVEGVIIWEQKQNDDGLKLRYYKNSLVEKNYIFQWTLNKQ